MRAVDARGRWIWGLSGVVTMAFLVVPGIHLITRAGQNEDAVPQSVTTRIVTVPQPVTSVTVQSHGGQVEITAEPVSRVQIRETITYDGKAGDLAVVPQKASASPLSAGPAGGASPAGQVSAVPAVQQSVSGGHLSLAASVCATSDCTVDFALAVPSDVSATVVTDGGQVTVAGIAGANLDSGMGTVIAANIRGPLTVSTGGGPLQLNGLAGSLSANTSGGSVTAEGITGATVTVSTGGGDAALSFSAAPDAVMVSTDGGAARLALPGGPYALMADSGGGPASIEAATAATAHRSVTVVSGGGLLQITPAGG